MGERLYSWSKKTVFWMLAFSYKTSADKAPNLRLRNIICVGNSVSLDLWLGFGDWKKTKRSDTREAEACLYIVVCS